MELRLLICSAIVMLAVSQCSVSGHTVQRRDAMDDVNYDEPYQADEASDYEAQNDAERDNSNDQPQPKKPPAVMLTTPTAYKAELGHDVLFQCKVNPEDETVVQWYKEDAMIAMGKRIINGDSRYSIVDNSKDLQIVGVQHSDSGVFKCVIVQEEPTAINHTLAVYELPKINMSASDGGQVAEDAELTLTCAVTGVPAPQVIWSVAKADDPNHSLTEKDGDFSISNNVYTLTIKRARVDQTGKYYCYAINAYGNTTVSLDVKVNPKPRVHVPRTLINSDIKVEAILECSAHEAPMPNIRWYKDGVVIEDSTPQLSVSTLGTHSNLTVVPSIDEDFGTFTCEAENLYGKHSKSIELVQRPVVEDISADGPRMAWTVHSHQPLEKMEVQIRNYTANGEWQPFSVPVPAVKGHNYEVIYELDRSKVEAGKYEALVKVKNNKGWGSSTDAVIVEIEEARPMMSIKGASAFGINSAHSIQSSAVVSTVLMYLLVRML